MRFGLVLTRTPSAVSTLTRFWLAAAGIGAFLPIAAAAYPDGAPWPNGHVSNSACASCHFDHPPQEDGDALKVEGIDKLVRAGVDYHLTIRFVPETGKFAGYQAIFERAGESVGVTFATDGQETQGSSVRSIVPTDLVEDGASWTLQWTAPDTPGPVVLHLSANAANDDGSPLGDRIHYRMLEFQVE